MKIQFIYTFKDFPQEILEYALDDLLILKTKESLTEFALGEFSEEEISDLIKISCCIYLEGGPDIETPAWYDECNGKLWFDNTND